MGDIGATLERLACPAFAAATAAFNRRHGIPPMKNVSSNLSTIRLPMATPMPFPHAGFLSQLEHIDTPASVPVARLPPSLARISLVAEGSGQPTPAAIHLIQLLKARKAVLQASFDTDVVADELRRYQKFAKPGQPSPHIVQLRQQQAAARQASSQSRQSFIKAAAAFVRETGIEVPPRVALEVFIIGWIEANVPKDAAAAT
jgi:hypothetical protein